MMFCRRWKTKWFISAGLCWSLMIRTTGSFRRRRRRYFSWRRRRQNS
jgi:hypothetical protein